MAVFKLFPAMCPKEAALINKQVAAGWRRTHGPVIKWNTVVNRACLILYQLSYSAYTDKS